MPPPCLLNNFPCEILFPSHSVFLSFSLSLSLVVGCLHLSWQLCASSPAIWNDSSHPGATARAVYWKRATHTLSNKSSPTPTCVHIHAVSFTQYLTHTHTPLHPGRNSEMRLLQFSVGTAGACARSWSFTLKIDAGVQQVSCAAESHPVHWRSFSHYLFDS